MSYFVRQSKYRHVYCEPAPQQNTFTNLRVTNVTGEQQYIKANTKFFAVGLQGGGGPLAVLKHDAYGKFDVNPPVLTGHKSAVLDFEFNPFHEHIIATGSEDLTVKVWGIPEDGLTENLTEPLVDLHGHRKKVTLLKFHPTASNVLASVAANYEVKLWDIEKSAELYSVDGEHTNLIHDIEWDFAGNTYFTSCKDKKVRRFDGRTGSVVDKIEEAHQGTKSVKLAFLGGKDQLATVGFTRQSGRQIKIWDPRNMSDKLKVIDMDTAPGVLMPFYDPDSCLLYIAGKGDGNIRYYEIVEESPFIIPISEFRTTKAAKGMCMVPKRGLDVARCETARLMKLTSNSVEPLSFIVPRKSDAFQEDLFPPSFSGEPSHTADEWLAGSDQPPKTRSLDPSLAGSAEEMKTTQADFKPAKPPAQLQQELDEALARIEVLEQRLREAGLDAS
mmetsp:Transcript_30028/g.39502  ORF Transcript_30028/g.39502 Transcript_30028/m.39502 type:complete len:444 (-) Transcript_30028:462-1793(-)